MAAIRQGRVRVQVGDGPAEVVLEAYRLIYPDEDLVWLDDQPQRPQAPTCYVMLNKPLGVVSIVRDPTGKPGLDPWMATLPEGTFAVGRLDRDTSGLLLLTNDGDLSFALMSPHHHVPRHYEVEVAATLTLADDPRLIALSGDLVLRDGTARARSVRVLEVDHEAERSRLEIVLGEGRKRQVRRMVGASGLTLLNLRRVRLGPLALGDLEPGALRALSEDEISALWESAGGADISRQGALRALRSQARDNRADGTPLVRLEAWLTAYGGGC
jgi:23S rRNA pseudouridine2605 synthase